MNYKRLLIFIESTIITPIIKIENDNMIGPFFWYLVYHRKPIITIFLGKEQLNQWLICFKEKNMVFAITCWLFYLLTFEALYRSLFARNGFTAMFSNSDFFAGFFLAVFLLQCFSCSLFLAVFFSQVFITQVFFYHVFCSLCLFLYVFLSVFSRLYFSLLLTVR